MDLSTAWKPLLKIKATLCMVVLCGCVASEDETTLRFWAFGREGEAVTALVREFEGLHPGFRVDVQQIPWSAGHEKLLTAFAGEALPDVFQIGNTWIPEFAALGALEPVPPAFKRDQIDAAVRASSLDGVLYAVPWYVDTRVIFYRKDLLAEAGWPEPPKDWGTWSSAMKAIRIRSDGRRYGMTAPLNDWTLLVILALQAGNTVLKEDARFSDLVSDSFRRAFASYLTLFREGLAPVVGEARSVNLYQDFASGNVCMFLSGPWSIGELRERLPSNLQARWATSVLPSDDGKGFGSSIGGGAGLALSRNSKLKPEALQLIEFLVAPERQLAFYQITGDLPSLRSAWLSPTLRSDPNLQVFQRQLENLADLPKIPEWERIAVKLAGFAERAIRSQISEEEALIQMDREVNVILEKRRWLLEPRR